MTKTDITKKVVKTVVALSVGWTATNVIANNTNPEKPHQKVEAAVGGLVLGHIASDYAERWTGDKIDAAIYWWKTNVTN